MSKCFHIFIITVMTLFFHAIHHSLNTRRAEILASLYFIDSCYYFISTLSICFILLLRIISNVRTYVLSYCFSFSSFNDLLLDTFFLIFLFVGSSFYFQFIFLSDHYCLVFETLGISIYDLIKRNDYTGFPLNCVRDLAR